MLPSRVIPIAPSEAAPGPVFPLAELHLCVPRRNFFGTGVSSRAAARSRSIVALQVP